MPAFIRFIPILFSFLVHGTLVGAMVFADLVEPVEPEKVYQVSLAEFAAPVTPTPVAPTVESVAPEPKIIEPPKPEPPKLEPPKPEPPKPEPPKPQTKKISPKKSKESAPQAPPAYAKPSAPALSGPVARNMGGLMAYDHDVVDQRPSISKRVIPEYPTKARRMNVEGKVIVSLVVDAQGHPKACAVYSATPVGYFEEAALAAAKKMQFIPGKLKGQPVNTLVTIPFAFSLR